ncbi:MAG: DNA primase [Candidatus Altiarchaeota archaeon]|nr:DNA primase [Candidatus Altiarchaeota archaeon]
MGKVSPVAVKYIVRAEITTIGMVEKPDVIGAIFGQTEGLLGQDLELRELQKSGRIGRIEVRLKTEKGKTTGVIEVPSSMDKAETAIIAAAMETIDRIGPCEATVKVKAVEDVREIKRQYIIERAKSVLKETLMRAPDTQELVSKVAEAVRQAEITSYGREKLPAGPMVGKSEELLLVEGRADVLTLLRYGIKNALALGGTKMPKEAIELSRRRETTIFVDGDRGGDLIIKDVLSVADIDFVTRAPDGKEVEELTSKEIQKAIRARESAEQYRANHKIRSYSSKTSSDDSSDTRSSRRRTLRKTERSDDVGKLASGRKTTTIKRTSSKASKLSKVKKDQFKKLLEDLLGTRGAYLLSGTEILGKVPTTELARYLEILKADTVVMDGKVNSRIASICKSRGIGLIVGKESDKIFGIDVITQADLEGK